jgi:hypothetical protein
MYNFAIYLWLESVCKSCLTPGVTIAGWEWWVWWDKWWWGDGPLIKPDGENLYSSLKKKKNMHK